MSDEELKALADADPALHKPELIAMAKEALRYRWLKARYHGADFNHSSVEPSRWFVLLFLMPADALVCADLDHTIDRNSNAAPQAATHAATQPGTFTPGAETGTPFQPAAAAPFAWQLAVELGRLFHVAPTTVQRWVSGESTPVPLGQESVLKLLREKQ